MGSEENKAVVRRFTEEVVSGRNVDATDEVLAPGLVNAAAHAAARKRLAVGASMIAALALASVALAGGNLPLGKYTTNVKSPARLKGTWVLNFMKGGKYTITDNGAVVVRGHFTSTSRIYLSNETGPAACPQFGVYAWKRTGKKLKLTKVSDPCVGRAIVLGLTFTATG